VKIAATITNCVQVGQYEYRDVRITCVFDSSQSIDAMIAWANSTKPTIPLHFGDLLLSEVDEEAGK